MSQALAVRVARLDQSLADAVKEIARLRAQVEEIGLMASHPLICVDPNPVAVEIMPRKRGRPRKIANV